MIDAWLRGYTIRLRMLGAIGMVLTLLALLAGTGLWSLAHLERAGRTFAEETFADATAASALRAQIGDIRRYEKDQIINYEKPEAVAKAQPLWQRSIDEARRQARALVHGTPDAGTASAEAIERLLGEYVRRATAVMKQVAAGAYDSATVANRLLEPAKEPMRGVEAEMDKLMAHLDAEQRNATAEREASTERAYLLFGLAALVAVVAVVPLTLANMRSICRPIEQARHLAECIATGDLTQEVDSRGRDEAAVLLTALTQMQQALRGLVGQVRDGAAAVQHSSREVAQGNEDLSSRTEQTAANLQQTASSMQELTGTVRAGADAASTASQLAAGAADAAQRGGQVVTQVVDTMQGIHDASRRIADITATIDAIAFQTNILALNAAVEAARAGEQGRGFAVVAGEVRNLAQRSATAAREIKDLIQQSTTQVEAGASLVQAAGRSMDDIVAGVQRVSDVIGEISAAANEQSGGIAQVNTAVSELDRMTQQNAALVEQSAAAAQSLAEQAARLAEAVARFHTGNERVAAHA